MLAPQAVIFWGFFLRVMSVALRPLVSVALRPPEMDWKTDSETDPELTAAGRELTAAGPELTAAGQQGRTPSPRPARADLVRRRQVMLEVPEPAAAAGFCASAGPLRSSAAGCGCGCDCGGAAPWCPGEQHHLRPG